MKKLFSIAILVSLFSCSVKTIPIQNNYEVKNSFTTTVQYDEIWKRLIALFTKNGIPIKIIDRSSGLIITEPLDSCQSKKHWQFRKNYFPRTYKIIAQKVWKYRVIHYFCNANSTNEVRDALKYIGLFLCLIFYIIDTKMVSYYHDRIEISITRPRKTVSNGSV